MGSIWFGRLREALLGLLLGGGAFFVVGEELSRAEASVREDPREDAFREWNRLLGRLEADAARGDGECRLLPDGVAFRGGPTYTWSARSGQVRRADGRGGAARVVAHGITAFEVHTTGKGPILVTAEASRGPDAAYRRTVRLDPR